jgi:hypothetical protein
MRNSVLVRMRLRTVLRVQTVFAKAQTNKQRARCARAKRARAARLFFFNLRIQKHPPCQFVRCIFRRFLVGARVWGPRAPPRAVAAVWVRR